VSKLKEALTMLANTLNATGASEYEEKGGTTYVRV